MQCHVTGGREDIYRVRNGGLRDKHTQCKKNVTDAWRSDEDEHLLSKQWRTRTCTCLSIAAMRSSNGHSNQFECWDATQGQYLNMGWGSTSMGMATRMAVRFCPPPASCTSI
jgi:hypothetical protein